MPRIAILVPAPAYEERWSAIKEDYQRLLGADTAFLNWTDCGDLNDFDLVSPLLAWGYPRDYPQWIELLNRFEAENIPVVNPASILRWNSDKAYLAELSMAGIATVPTRMVNHLRSEDLAAAQADFGTDILVVKPPISGGADGTYKLTSQDKIPEQVSGKRMMIQPFLSNITDEGEYSLFYFGGQLSHAILKRPATGDFRVQEQFGGTETSIVPAEQAKLVSEAAMAAACGINHCPDLAYARVDLLRGNDGKFLLMELELIEPSLFLRFADDNGSAFAEKMLQVASANLG